VLLTTEEKHVISVCMATFNGASYVSEQILSILPQLSHSDELVIVDDDSTDDTVAQVERFDDPRIRLVRSDRNTGYVQAFGRALAAAEGDMILLADQDDVWTPDHVESLVAALRRADIAASNLVVLDSGQPLRSPFSKRPWRLFSSRSQRHRLNILGILAGTIPYFGCTMAVRRSALQVILPFPSFLTESHDLWIAIVGNVSRSIAHVDAVTVLRRVHENNASSARPRGMFTILASRWMLGKALIAASRRVRAKGTPGPSYWHM